MWEEAIEELEKRHKDAQRGGGEKRVEKQHQSGKLTARERIDILLDKNTFTEIDELLESRINDFGLDKKRVPGDGVITGYGKVDGRMVMIAVEDFTVIGGTLGEYHSKKICKVQDMAMDMGIPFLALNDSGGARIEEGISSLSGYSGMFLRNTKASGVIPQIAVILGPCSGGACYSPAICDFTFMVRDISKMFITGPQVVKTVIGEVTTVEELGGCDVHDIKSGVAHFVCNDEKSCLEKVRSLISYLPENCTKKPPMKVGQPVDFSDRITSFVPDNNRKSYDVHEVINSIVDKNSFLEIQENFARNAVIGLARMDGEVLGIVANQPNHMGGALDCDASDKMARFIRFCDCFNIPLVTLVDVPAFFPGKEQEHKGIIRHGAKLLYAFSEATVPKVSLIMRKAYGGAYIAMNSKNMGADIVYAWPIAEIAVMGAEGAVNIMSRKTIEQADDSEMKRGQLIDEYEKKFLNPFIAAERGYVDEIIRPGDTREKISTALRLLKTKKVEVPSKKHGNIPL